MLDSNTWKHLMMCKQMISGAFKNVAYEPGGCQNMQIDISHKVPSSLKRPDWTHRK